MLKNIARFIALVNNMRRGRLFANRYHSHGSEGQASPAKSPGALEAYFDSIKEGLGIWKWRHYFPIYERHFAKFVGREVHIVEVGICSGGSLPMWRHYFGPQCRVYGIDIEEACRVYEGEGVKVFIGDQADRKFWKDVREQVPRVDILIDDGGHEPEQQIVTLEEMLPHVSRGGVYLCEDIDGIHNRFAAYIGGLQHGMNYLRYEPGPVAAASVNEFQRDIESIHVYPLCVVVEKSDSPVERLCSERHGTQWQPFH